MRNENQMEGKMKEKARRWSKKAWGTIYRVLCNLLEFPVRITVGIVVMLLVYPILDWIIQSDSARDVIASTILFIVIFFRRWKFTLPMLLGIINMGVAWVSTEDVIITAIVGVVTRLAEFSKEKQEETLKKLETSLQEKVRGLEEKQKDTLKQMEALLHQEY